MTAALYWTGWLLVGCAGLLAVLLAIEWLVLRWQARTTFRRLPAPDLPDLRVQRALAAYRNNARAYSGLR